MVSTSFTLPVPDVPGCRIPGFVALDHPNVDPDVALAGTYVKVDPLQIAAGVSVVLSTGVGFIVTTTFCGVLLYPLAVVVYTYVTTIGAGVVLISTSNTLPVPEAPTGMIPGKVALVHAKVAPGVMLVAV